MALTKRQMSNFRRRKSRFGGAVPVIVQKSKRKRRRGPKITKLLKDKTVAKLRYVDTISLNAASAGIASHRFSCNGIFDPDITGTGHQPLMRDEYALLYGSYRVISSTFKATPISASSANVVPSLWGVYRDPDAAIGFSEGTSIIEDQRNKGSWGIHTGFTTSKMVAGNGRQNSLRMSFKAKRDLSAEAAINVNLQAVNPTVGTEEMYFRLWHSSILGNDPGSVSFLIQVEYVVEFTDPLHVTPS